MDEDNKGWGIIVTKDEAAKEANPVPEYVERGISDTHCER